MLPPKGGPPARRSALDEYTSLTIRWPRTTIASENSIPRCYGLNPQHWHAMNAVLPFGPGGFMSSRFLLPLLFLSLYLTQTKSGYAAGFLEAKSYPGGAGTLAMATGDFNSDGHVDVALANSNANTVGIVLGNSDGSFQAPLNFSGGTGVDYLAVGDFNGDGKLDVVTVSHLGASANILFGNGDGTLQTA